MRLVDLVEKRAREFMLSSGKAVLLAQLHQLGVVAYVDDAKGIVLGAQPQGYLAGRALQVLDIKPTTTRGVEECRKSLIEDLRRRESANIEVLEAPGEQIFARCGDKATSEPMKSPS